MEPVRQDQRPDGREHQDGEEPQDHVGQFRGGRPDLVGQLEQHQVDQEAATTDSDGPQASQVGERTRLRLGPGGFTVADTVRLPRSVAYAGPVMTLTDSSLVDDRSEIVTGNASRSSKPRPQLPQAANRRRTPCNQAAPADTQRQQQRGQKRPCRIAAGHETAVLVFTRQRSAAHVVMLVSSSWSYFGAVA
jgi:hypothetical protein